MLTCRPTGDSEPGAEYNMFSIYTYYLGYHRFIIVIDTVGTYMDSLQPLVYRLNSAVLVYTALIIPLWCMGCCIKTRLVITLLGV